MSAEPTLHYIEAIETLLTQWDDVMVSTLDAIEQQNRSLLPVFRIRLLAEQLLNHIPPPSCRRLHKDLNRLIRTHSWFLYVAFKAPDDVAPVYGEYQEALVATHAEVIRLRTYYQLET